MALEATSGPGWSYRWGWAAVTVGIILLGVLAVPPVRAALVEMLQLGAVRIFLTEPTPIPTSLPPTSQSLPTDDHRADADGYAGQLGFGSGRRNHLVEAQQRVDFPIRLPAYPADLGQPIASLCKISPGRSLSWSGSIRINPSVRLSLHMLGPNTYAQKKCSRR
ncbi:MAG: hypothetical protein H6633_05345 [Anaerolineales bacterium]|nr:hypothetical protein [Anaerolineales bacterium]